MGRPRKAGSTTPSARRFPALADATPEALAFIHAVFERVRLGAGPTWGAVVAALKERFGIPWEDSGLSRYYAYWSSNLYVLDRAMEHSADLVEAYKRQPTQEIEEQIRQELTALRLLSMRGLESADPVQVARLGVQADRLELDREKLDLGRRQVEINEGLADLERRKVELRERAAAAVQAIEKKVAGKTQLSPEDLQTIREQLYGIAGAPENA